MSDQPANILLLEDVTTVQFFVRNALCGLPKPYTLFTAGSLAQARDIIVDKQIDLFIVDIGLPDGDGIDFLCEAAILHPQATAIIVTATPTEEHRARRATRHRPAPLKTHPARETRRFSEKIDGLE